MMRAGISRVVVEIIILVIAVALALLIFSPISGYIFGSLGRTSTVGGASQIQILNAQWVDDTQKTLKIDIKNLGPGTITFSSTPENDFKVYVDGTSYTVNDIKKGGNSVTSTDTWGKDEVVTVECSPPNSGTFDTTKQHSIVIYGPGNTQAQYLYYPSG
jgi:archaellum component FlaG (FlaF/FlaG flagellin family)